jgi:hypothetical protein
VSTLVLECWWIELHHQFANCFADIASVVQFHSHQDASNHRSFLLPSKLCHLCISFETFHFQIIIIEQNWYRCICLPTDLRVKQLFLHVRNINNSSFNNS